MKRSPRSGKSLIEMLVMISLLSIILGLSATTLASLFRLRSTISKDTDQARSIDRLATRWRTDAHEATSASVGETCELKLSDNRSIRYSFAVPRVTREVYDGDEIVHRDSFALSRNSSVTFQTEPFGTGQLIRAIVETVNNRLPVRELPRSARIEAAVGIHGVLATSGAQP